jgi:plastocyanin
MRALFSIFAFSIFAATAFGDPILVTDQAGKPVANAVVTFAGASSVSSDYGQPLKIRQQDMMFQPYVLVAPVGAEIEFPNFDRVRHHVYSFSKGNRFQLELYGREEHRTVTFDTAGTVAIGCNIHDSMLAYIRVVDAAYGGVTNAEGIVELDALPAGLTMAQVWQPDMSGGTEVSVELSRTGDSLQLVMPGAFVMPPAGALQ